MDDAVLRTVREMRLAMAPALREILTTDELAATRIDAVREPADRAGRTIPISDWAPVGDEERLDDGILLRVQTYTDSTGLWAGRETAAELHVRFRSDLQDFAAESRFAWGQWRP